MEAAYWGEVNTVKALINAGASLNEIDKVPCTLSSHFTAHKREI
jgi:hypothetical protein